MEARSQAMGELGGYGVEEQFRSLESGDVEDELALMKAQIAGELPGATPTQESLPSSAETQKSTSPKDPVVDAELEDLRRQIDKL
jgi:phage shock protein A